MIKKFHQINQRILEKYPTLWNTKLIWMLGIASVLHLLFFILGYIWYSNPESLQISSAEQAYFSSGLVYIQCIISLVLLVGWVIQLFKNNAFKNFYPSTPWKMFVQFIHFLVIIFASISFYFSFTIGAQSYLRNNYSDEEMASNVRVINRTMAFLPFDIEFYTVDNRINPELFENLYCETNTEYIDKSKPYLNFKDRFYQYYDLLAVPSTKKSQDGFFIEPLKGKTSVREVEKDAKTKIFYYKKNVVDVSNYFKTSNPSFYNFSQVFSENPYLNNYQNTHYTSYENQSLVSISKEKKTITEMNALMMQTANKDEFKKLFEQFFKISDKYKIKTNLNAEVLLSMVYNPNQYEVKQYIKRYESKNKKYNRNDVPHLSVDYELTEATSTANTSAVEKDFESKLSDKYFYDTNLLNVIDNVLKIKNTEILTYSFMILFAISFGLASILLCYRVTSAKSLIFSFITIGISALFLVIFNLALLSIIGTSEVTYQISTLGLYLLFLFTGFVGFNRVKKNILAVIINVVILMMPFMIAMVFFIISHLQKLNCPDSSDYTYYLANCPTVLSTLDFYLIYVVIGISIPLIYLYLYYIHKWKARPE